MLTTEQPQVKPLRIDQPRQRYGILPAKNMDEGHIYRYWGDLEAADLLKYRWCDKQPDELHVSAIGDYAMMNGSTYMVVDTLKRKVIGEFTLESFTGGAAQVHFSTHPDNTPAVNRSLASKVTDDILYQWKKPNSNEPYLITLYGLTPAPNRAARIYLLRAGFKNMGVLIAGTRYEGNVCDAVMSMKTRAN